MRSKLPMSSPSTVSGWRRARAVTPARSTTAQRRSLISAAWAPSVMRGIGRDAVGAEAGDAATVAAAASGAGEEFAARCILIGARGSDDAADRGVEAEAADVAPERDGAEHRAAIGIKHDRGAGEVAALHEQFEVARRLRGDGAARRNPQPALGAAGVGRA